MTKLIRYNYAVKLLLPIATFATLLLFGASCDYPEAGFYALQVSDAYGKPLASYPFSVEELVDDTEMTTGFQVLLPSIKEIPTLAVATLENGPPLEHRTWTLFLADADSGAGDLALEILHERDILSFTGIYRAEPDGTIELLGGQVDPGEESGRLALVAQPRTVPQAGSAVKWEIRKIAKAVFEKALGGKYEDAGRIPAASPGEDFLEAFQNGQGGAGSVAAAPAEVADVKSVPSAAPQRAGRSEPSKPPRRYGQRPR